MYNYTESVHSFGILISNSPLLLGALGSVALGATSLAAPHFLTSFFLTSFRLWFVCGRQQAPGVGAYNLCQVKFSGGEDLGNRILWVGRVSWRR
jgi:hypothetical protein